MRQRKLSVGTSGEKKGASEEKLAKRALDSFAACKALHEELLSAADSPAAKAVLRFFETWDPEKAAAYLAEKADEEILNDLRKGANLLFRAESGFVHEDPAVRAAWNSHYNKESDGPRGICLVTGEEGPIEKIHPAIKNVAGAQPSGAALVSFNAPAFCSYGKEQNLNAPTGKYAAFAYTTALNYLLADRDHVYHIGDTSVVCWAKGGESAYNALFGAACFGADTSYTTADLRGMVESLCKGEPVEYDDAKLSPTMDFYVLGLSRMRRGYRCGFSCTIRSAAFWKMYRPIITGLKLCGRHLTNLRFCPFGGFFTKRSTKMHAPKRRHRILRARCCAPS